MNSGIFSGELASTVLGMAAKGGLISLAALAVVMALRRASAASRHLVLSLAAAALLALPVLVVLLPSREISVLPAVSQSSSQPKALTPWPPLPRGEGESGNVGWRRPSPTGRGVGGEGFTVPVTLFPLAISAFLLLRLFLAVRRLSGLYAGSLPAPQEWLEIVDENRRRLGIARPVRLGVSGAIAVPVTFGWWRPVVLLPQAARSWAEQQVREALIHELAHVRRRDWPVQMIARVACALHWLNPLVWLLRRRLLLEAELACDDQVLRAGTGAEGYAERLVALAREVRSAAKRPATAVAFARSSGLASRVSAILDSGRRRGGPGRFAVAATALAALAFLVLVAPARLVRAEPRSGEAPEERVQRPLPPLFQAAWEGDEAEVRRLLAGGADPNQAVPRLGTPLIVAAGRGHERVVEALLEAGADPNAAVVGDGTPLIAAAREGHADVVRRLLAVGANPNVYVTGDETALRQAIENGHAEATRVLLDAWRAPLPEDGQERSVRGGVLGGVEGGVRGGVRGGVAGGVIGGGVEGGVRGGVEGGVRGGVEGGVRGGVRGGVVNDGWLEAITDGVEEGKREALVEAAAEGAIEAVRVLLQAGADPDAVVPGDGTPLIAASRAGHAEVVRLLIDAGADVDKVAPNDENPLIQAAWHGHLDVVRLLLEAGAYPNVAVNANRTPEDPGGELRTPLGMARRAGHRDVEKLLLEHGARD